MSRRFRRKSVFRPLGLLLVSCLLLSYASVSHAGAAEPRRLHAPTPGPGAPVPLIAPVGLPASTEIHPSAATEGSTTSEIGPEVVVGIGPSLSEPVRDMPSSPEPPFRGELEAGPSNERILPKALSPLAQSAEGFDAAIVQSSLVGSSMPVPVASFDGVSNFNGVGEPPDAEGDIGYDPSSGKKYYMQWVNYSYVIWDATGPGAPVQLFAPKNGNSLFSGLGPVCETSNSGDPIVLFDHLANRWFASQFTALDGAPYYQCIAVSQTADPTGSWYGYAFLWGSKMNGDPKFGVWPDGYYMSANQWTGNTWAGAGVAVFDRTKMLAGDPLPTMQKFDLGTVGLNYGNMLPSDLDGLAPAAGTPNYFSEWDDTTFLGDANDTLRIWNFHVDWAIPANSTFGSSPSFAPNQLIATSNVDPYLCGTTGGACIRQKGTLQRLETLSDRLMYRMQYRDFGSYQTLVSNHSVDANGLDKAGIYWYELRSAIGGWSMYQQGVYAPDTNSRWMGSIAMDKDGNMALGFSVSSSSTYPSVHYTGRCAGDALGLMPQGEGSLVSGGGSQTGSSRWGDYSMMAVDPLDDSTFWYTQEYYWPSSSVGWRTRIGAFRFPTHCNPVGTVTAVYPFDGATVCQLHPVGVQFLIAGLDPTPQTLMLDATDVTVPAMKWELLTNPERAIYMYMPTTDLSVGPHDASFTYSRQGVPATFIWNFTVDGTACPIFLPVPTNEEPFLEVPGVIGGPSAH